MWLLDEGLIMAVDHEPLSFQRRVGHAAANEAERFDLRHAEETFRRAKENGVNAIRAHFYKGAGYRIETQERARTKEISRICRKVGIHLQLYVQFGTISYETMRAEEPDVLDWVQKDKHGEPITLVYGHQSYRYYPCFNSPGYWDYLEGILRDGLENYDPDMIGLDNITTGEEPSVCQCPRCREGFVRYLKQKYDADTPEGLEKCIDRLGHAELDYILPPEWNHYNTHDSLRDIKNPVIQEWLLFRMESTKRVVERIYRFIKSIAPDVLVEINAYKMFGVNTAFINGLYLPDLRDGMDIFWNECDPQPDYTEEGQLLHRIRSYKTARALGKRVFTTSRDRRGFAESMAFNGGLINGIETLLKSAYGDMSCVRAYRDFRSAHAAAFSAAPIARIGLFESRESLSFSNFDVWFSDILAQAMLLGRQLPYDLMLDTRSLDRYRAVVVPGMRCLGEADRDALLRYAEGGGTLLLIGDAGEYDAWFRSLREESLRKRLGITGEGYRGLYRQKVGKGIAYWCPAVHNAHPFREEDFARNPFRVTYLHVQNASWIPPYESDLLADCLREHAALPVDIDAPEYIVSEITEDAGGYYAHLVCFKQHAEPAAIRIACGEAIRATLWDADTGIDTPLERTPSGQFVVSSLQTYAIVRLERQVKGVH